MGSKEILQFWWVPAVLGGAFALASILAREDSEDDPKVRCIGGEIWERKARAVYQKAQNMDGLPIPCMSDAPRYPPNTARR